MFAMQIQLNQPIDFEARIVVNPYPNNYHFQRVYASYPDIPEQNIVHVAQGIAGFTCFDGCIDPKTVMKSNLIIIPSTNPTSPLTADIDLRAEVAANLTPLPYENESFMKVTEIKVPSLYKALFLLF